MSNTTNRTIDADLDKDIKDLAKKLFQDGATLGELKGITRRELNAVYQMGLGSYKTALDNSYVMKDLKNFQKFPEFMDNDLGMLWDNTLSDMVLNIFKKLYLVDGSGEIPVKQKIMPLVKEVGIFKIAKLAMKGMKAL